MNELNPYKINTIAIFLKPKSIQDFHSILPNLIGWLSRRQKKILFLSQEEERLQKILKHKKYSYQLVSKDGAFDEADLIVTLGGDGTLIGVTRKATKTTPPIFGINMGRLGFITEFSKVEFFDFLEDIFNKNKIIYSKLPLFKVEVIKKNQTLLKSFFVNDIVFSKNEISRIFSLNVTVDDEHLFNLAGDGLIISSPIGSTAYSLAAGGPIIHPSVKSIVLTPICPHGLTLRPIVIPDNFSLEIKPNDKGDTISITLDGQEVINIDSSTVVKVQKSKNRYAKLITNQSSSYFNTLKEKFTYGRRS